MENSKPGSRSLVFKIDKNLYFKSIQLVYAISNTGKRHVQKIQHTAKIYVN